MVKKVQNIVLWLENWFSQTKDVVLRNQGQANKNLVTDASGNVVLEDKPVIPDVSGKIDTAGTGLSKSGTTLNHMNSITAQTNNVFKKFKYDAQGHITGTANVTANDLPQHTHSSDLVVDTTSQNYGNIGITTMGATQQEINTAINTKLGQIANIEVIKVVSTKPTASADTMNTLYIVSENGKVNVYYTKKSGSTYSWEKLDDNILDELSISWSDITGKPFTTVDSVLSSSSTNPLQNKAINTALNNKANANHTHTITNISDATDNILVPNGADYTIFKNTTGRNVPLDVVLQSFGVYSANLYNNKEDKGECITSIELIPKSQDATGAIRLYYGDEPTNNS
nr:hypothetical protein [uncultured Methanobrevibacter sp.]